MVARFSDPGTRPERQICSLDVESSQSKQEDSRLEHTRSLAAASVGFVALLLAAAAAAPPPSASPKTSGAPKAQSAALVEKPKPKMVCEETPQPGSRFERKVCATPEDWEARRLRDQQEMQRMGGQAKECNSAAGAC